MITLDQVLLLQEKVESAVVKIEQLKAENAALRSKCAELTNALSAKTEQFSTFEADQSKIEHGILKALERLNAVENAVVQAAHEVAAAPSEPAATPQEPIDELQPEHIQASEPYMAEQSVDMLEPTQDDAAAEQISETIDSSMEPQIDATQDVSVHDEAQGQFDIF